MSQLTKEMGYICVFLAFNISVYYLSYALLPYIDAMATVVKNHFHLVLENHIASNSRIANTSANQL